MLLAKHDITMGELGRRVGATPHAISQVINGLRPHSKLVPKIAEVFGVPVEDLLVDEEEARETDDETPQQQAA